MRRCWHLLLPKPFSDAYFAFWFHTKSGFHIHVHHASLFTLFTPSSQIANMLYINKINHLKAIWIYYIAAKTYLSKGKFQLLPLILMHIVWKSPKMSQLIFWILAFSTNFVLLRLTCLVALFDRKLQFFKKSPQLTNIGTFDKLLSTQNVNVARFARNVLMLLFLWFSHTVTPCGNSLNRYAKEFLLLELRKLPRFCYILEN